MQNSGTLEQTKGEQLAQIFADWSSVHVEKWKAGN